MKLTVEDRITEVEALLERVVYGEDEIGNLTSAVAQLLEIVRVQQAEIKRLTDESNNHRH